MEVAIKSVGNFLLLYFAYYFILRFIQSVFQVTAGSINSNLGKFLYAFSTPAHELAHLLVAILCLAKIERVQLFPKGNVPGFVKTRIGSRVPFLINIKEFLVSMAPALINIPLFIFIESKFVLKCKVSEISRILDPRTIFTKEGFITILLFLMLISGIAPSHEDFKGMVKGLIIFSFIIFGMSYVSSIFIGIGNINMSPILNVILYYIEIIVIILIINGIINYRNCLKVTSNILVNALKHAFKRN
jgi:hypothetical protein